MRLQWYYLASWTCSWSRVSLQFSQVSFSLYFCVLWRVLKVISKNVGTPRPQHQCHYRWVWPRKPALLMFPCVVVMQQRYGGKTTPVAWSEAISDRNFRPEIIWIHKETERLSSDQRQKPFSKIIWNQQPKDTELSEKDNSVLLTTFLTDWNRQWRRCHPPLIMFMLRKTNRWIVTISKFTAVINLSLSGQN